MMGQQLPPADEVEVLAWLPSCQEDAEFGTPERQKEYATTLKTEGLHAAVWMYEPIALRTVSALHEEIGLNVNPWVPNMRAYLRDASEHGVVGAALQRFMRLPLPDKARIAFHNISRAIGVVRRDFTTGLLIMVDMELVRFRRYGASAAFPGRSRQSRHRRCPKRPAPSAADRLKRSWRRLFFVVQYGHCDWKAPDDEFLY